MIDMKNDTAIMAYRSHHASKQRYHNTQHNIGEGIDGEHVARFELAHQHGSHPSAKQECKHVDAEECSRGGFAYACIGAAVDKEEAVDCRLSSVIEELGHYAFGEVRAFEYTEINKLSRSAVTFVYFGSFEKMNITAIITSIRARAA